MRVLASMLIAKQNVVFTLIGRIWRQLSSNQKSAYRRIFLLTILTAFAEIVTLSTLIPFIGLLVSPKEVFEEKYILYLSDIYKFKDEAEAVVFLTFTFIVIILLSSMLRIVQLWATARASYGAGTIISEKLFKIFLFMPFEQQLTIPSSEVISSIGKVHIFVDAIVQIVRLLSSSIIFLSIFIALMFINTNVAIFAFLFFGGAYLGINNAVRAKLKKNSQLIARNRTQVVKVLQDGLGSLREIILAGTKTYFLNLLRVADFSLRRAESDNAIIEGAPRFIIEAFGIIFVSFLAAFLFFKEGGIGSSLPLLGVLALSAQRMLPALQQGYNAWTAIKGHESSLCEMLEILENENYPIFDNDDNKSMKFNSKITFEDVSFSYRGSKKQVLKKLNFQIKAGDKVGIMGPSGSGKSTLLDLILGLLPPSSGSMLIGQEVLTTNTLSLWQKNIALVPQTIFLIDGTVAENIAFGESSRSVDHKRVALAAAAACVDDFVSKLPLKLETRVGERGVMLSGGELQRIGIARALYKNKSLIVLDEATTALDDKTEKKVLKNIFKMASTKTIIIVSHKKSNLDHCNLLLLVEDGEVLFAE